MGKSVIMIKGRAYFFFTIMGCAFFLHHAIEAATFTVTDAGDTGVGGTLRYSILVAAPGDSIVFDPSVTNISLSAPLPVITQGSLTITGPVTIDGASTYSVFSCVPPTPSAGTLTLTNIIIQNGKSKGGNGGNGGSNGGGGGGAGGGGGLYIHNGAQVNLNTMQFTNSTAIGGNGGNNSGGTNGGGGGGGGFGGGNGGAGGSNISGGGGGGGNKAGAGGSNADGGDGGAINTEQGGGGGGGSGSNSSGKNGGVAYLPPTGFYKSLGGTNNGGAGGGGGAGINSNPYPPPSPPAGAGGNATSTSGGAGGLGAGIDGFFGGGGGGGAPIAGGQFFGGAGTGNGGGGGGPSGVSSTNSQGGAGGSSGGGGGGGGPSTSTVGGAGGFGAGGGAGVTGGLSLFGGGDGTSNTGAAGGGGGGAGMGGAIFIQDQATLTIADSLSLSGNTAAGGSGGNNGTGYGDDIFIRSGGTLIFKNSATLTISSNIESNQGMGGQAVPGQGGLILNSTGGTGTLVLQGINTYTATTTIQSGILSISSNDNLGDTTLNSGTGNNVVIGSGTLQTMTNNISTPRLFSLTGGATIDTTTTTLTLTGIISGSGSLTKQGTGTLILSPAFNNTYAGGTTIAAGTVQIGPVGTPGRDAALGALNSRITMASGTTLNIIGAANLQSQRPFLLQGPATFQIDNTATTFLSGNISGSGELIKTGAEALFLGGTNTYSGGTDVQSGTLAGTTNSLQGDITIEDGATLLFLQTPAPGTFQGTLSTNLPTNSGVLQIGNATLTPFPQVTIVGANPNFLGPTDIFPSGVLNVNGSIANSSLVTISLGGFLSGTGTVGPVDSFGTIRPGNSIGTLTVNGDLVLETTSNLIIEIDPTQSSRLVVLGERTLEGTLTVVPNISGFFGLGASYTIETNTGNSPTGMFSSLNSPPNFIPTVDYFMNSVVLNIFIQQPFLGFPYDNPNEESVGNNINALTSQGYLTASSPLGEAINSLVGFPDSAINNALDQMHPAAFSAFAEIQAALGGQLLTLFHRRPVPHCACADRGRFWIEPYGNWLKEKNLGYELGFHAYSKGAALGFDGELTDGWVVGLGAAWNDTHMHWAKGRGFSTITGYYGSIYTDYTNDNFYIGLSCVAGWDRCYSSRHIRFSTIDEHARSTRHNLELMGQLTTALFFGPSFCFAFPYLNIDYFYLKEKQANESGAPGLNLQVYDHSGSTLRSEAGFAVQVQDVNRANTICLSPLFGLGWAMEMPINRSPYRSNFEDQPISFESYGWDYTWQLFTLRFGLSLTYNCLSISGGYVAEMSPLEHTPFFDQRGDIRLELSW